MQMQSQSNSQTSSGSLAEFSSRPSANDSAAPEAKDPARIIDLAMTFLLAAILLVLVVARFAFLRPSSESSPIEVPPRPHASLSR